MQLAVFAAPVANGVARDDRWTSERAEQEAGGEPEDRAAEQAEPGRLAA